MAEAETGRLQVFGPLCPGYNVRCWEGSACWPPTRHLRSPDCFPHPSPHPWPTPGSCQPYLPDRQPLPAATISAARHHQLPVHDHSRPHLASPCLLPSLHLWPPEGSDRISQALPFRSQLPLGRTAPLTTAHAAQTLGEDVGGAGRGLAETAMQGGGSTPPGLCLQEAWPRAVGRTQQLCPLEA